jgi:hypothetical protein
MCPLCISTAALAVAGATSTGGLAAILARRLGARERPKQMPARKDRALDARASETPRGE